MISFHHEDVDLPKLEIHKLEKWLHQLAHERDYSIYELNYIFCSDEYLLKINQEYLQHDYYTDIITFDNSDKEGEVISDVFISIDRIKDHGEQYKDGYVTELIRVIAHGVLHLIGFNDKTDQEQEEMTRMENYAIKLYKEL